MDTFESNPTDYTVAASPYDGGGTGTVARETGAGNYMQGSSSIKLVCPEGTTLRVNRHFATDQDWSTFSGGASSDSDFFTVRVKCSNPDWLDGFQVIVDVNGAEGKDYFYTPGKIVPGVKYESQAQRKATNAKTSMIYDMTIAMTSKSEVVTQEAISLEYLPYTTSDWAVFKVPKGDFTRQGDTASKGWNTVHQLSFIVWASKDTGGSNLDVYLDDAKIIGAAGDEEGLNGDYYFCAGYYNSTRDEYFEVSTETGPVEFVQQNVNVAGVPASFNAQADKYIVWVRAANGSLWYQLAQYSAGAAAADVNCSTEWMLSQPELTEQAGIYPLPKQLPSGQIRTRSTSNNSVPPAGDYITFHQGKLFVFHDDKVYHSKPGQPWAVPEDFYLRQATNSDPFTAAYSDGATLICHTKSRDMVYVNPGEYDAGFVYMGYLSPGVSTRGCVAPHSVDSGIYVSSQGVCSFDGSTSALLTKAKLHPTFRAISSKTTLHGAVYEDMYLLVNPGGNSIVMERVGDALRFIEWRFTGTARCCCVDRQTNRLYIGTDTGIYYYDTGSYKDSEGSFTLTALTKKFEIGGEAEDTPVERFMLDANAGGNSTVISVLVDGVSHGTKTVSGTTRTESEGFMDMGAIGSFVQLSISATVSSGSPVKVYAIEVD
jgi:hypothetical protein